MSVMSFERLVQQEAVEHTVKRSVCVMNDVSTDVLVIGGGCAAARAALEAHESGVDVTIVTKGSFGSSGTSGCKRIVTPGGFSVADGDVDATDHPDIHFKDIVLAGSGMCDEKLARILVDEAPVALRDLEQRGVKFEKDSSGRYVEFQGCFASRPRSHIVRPHALPILNALVTDVNRRPITVRQSTMIVDLVVENNTCYGAFGVNQNGEIEIFRANSVVLATGGGVGVFLRSFSPSDITGDGYAMAYRAGAELSNMEFIQAGIGVWSEELVVPAWFWLLKPDLYDSNKRRFIQRHIPAGTTAERVFEMKSNHWPFSSRDCSKYVEISVEKRRLARKKQERDRVYMDFREVSEAVLDQAVEYSAFKDMWAKDKAIFVSRGVDLEHTPVEIGTFAHAFNGGLVIDEQASTTVKGLYAAGEVAAGPHGADRLGGNMLVACQVFGARAGKYAAVSARQTQHMRTRKYMPDLAKERIDGLRTVQGRISPSKFRLELQRSMQENVLILRSERSLARALKDVCRIRDEAKHDVSIRTDDELVQAIELENILDVAQLVVEAARRRKESRGSHYREDFPSRDDGEFSQAIKVRLRLPQ
ncbi:MAG: FAD-binding protein [Planctomycetes bacterium]|nr:FAD-binding protein [Planctomycetota bacterium]